MADGIHQCAAAYVDDQFARSQHDLLLEHRRQEKRLLAFHLDRLGSHDRNGKAGEDRYVARVAMIDRRQREVENKMHARHNSLGGRLAAMTRKGRDRQEAERETLQERGDQLHAKAYRNLQALQERQFEAKQRDRIFAAREIKGRRDEHRDERQQLVKAHQQTREIKAEVRKQQMHDAAEQALKRGLQELKQKQGRTLSR